MLPAFTECISVVQETLRAAERVDNHVLADVKGVNNRLYLHYSWLSYRSCLISFSLQIYLLADEYDAFSNEYLDPDDLNAWNALRTNEQSLLKGFWARVKANLGPQRIGKCFITGVITSLNGRSYQRFQRCNECLI